MRGNNNNNNVHQTAGASHQHQKMAMIKNNNGNNNNNINEGTIILPKSTKDASGAQDTIYLCNFRVSVDGEWLCLKELQDGLDTSRIDEGVKRTDHDKGQIANNFGIVENDKCEEKIVERDWVNYYCRCFFLLTKFHLF
jgi:hypothetical protein